MVQTGTEEEEDEEEATTADDDEEKEEEDENEEDSEGVLDRNAESRCLRVRRRFALGDVLSASFSSSSLFSFVSSFSFLPSASSLSSLSSSTSLSSSSSSSEWLCRRRRLEALVAAGFECAVDLERVARARVLDFVVVMLSCSCCFDAVGFLLLLEEEEDCF